MEPIHQAAYEGNLGEVERLLNEDINRLNLQLQQDTPSYPKGATALMIAAGEGQSAVVERLLDLGAIVDIKDDEGWTALHVAAYYNRAPIVFVLWQAGANPMIQDDVGRTPGDWARCYHHSESCAILDVAIIESLRLRLSRQ